MIGLLGGETVVVLLPEQLEEREDFPSLVGFLELVLEVLDQRCLGVCVEDVAADEFLLDRQVGDRRLGPVRQVGFVDDVWRHALQLVERIVELGDRVVARPRMHEIIPFLQLDRFRQQVATSELPDEHGPHRLVEGERVVQLVAARLRSKRIRAEGEEEQLAFADLLKDPFPPFLAASDRLRVEKRRMTVALGDPSVELFDDLDVGP